MASVCVDVLSYASGEIHYTAYFSFPGGMDGTIRFASFGIRATLPGASFVSTAQVNKTMFTGCVTADSITLSSSLSGLPSLGVGEPFDLFFQFQVGASRCGDTVRFTVPFGGTVPASYLINERPALTTQSVFYDGSFVGEVGSCLTNSIVACKEIHELRQGKAHTKCSLGWFFGATDCASDVRVCASHIVTRGAPVYEAVDCSAYGVDGYPDSLLEADARALYRKCGAMPEYSLPQKCAEYTLLLREGISYPAVCAAIQNTGHGASNSTAVFMLLGVDPTIDAIGIGSTTPVGPLQGASRGLHAMAVLGWKTISGKKYWICQNSWTDQFNRRYGDNGLFYIPWSWIGIGYEGVYGFVILQDDSNAPPLPDIVVPEIPAPVTKRRGPNYLIVSAPPVEGATDYQVQWYEPVTGYRRVTDYGEINGWNFNDGYVPAANDMPLQLDISNGLFGRTFTVQLRYNKSGTWSDWSAESRLTALPYNPGDCLLTASGATGIRVQVPVLSWSWFDVTDPGRFAFVRVYYSTSPNVSDVAYQGYRDFQYPNQGGVISGLSSGATYYFTAMTHLVVNGVALKSYYRSNAVAFRVGHPAPWSWTDSNGAATAAQTQAAYHALVHQGETRNFSHLVWNDMVNKVVEAWHAKEGYFNTRYASYEETLLSPPDKALTAKRFNSLRYNVGLNASTGIAEVHAGDAVLGRYFITLADKLNAWISTM